MNKDLKPIAGALALSLPLLVAAQAARSDPADPQASAPALRYPSAFADSKPYQDIDTGAR